VIYPYFHISRSNTLQKSSYIKGDSNEWLEQGVITQIDQVTSSSRAFVISDIEFVIFMGLRIDNEIKNTSRIEDTWRHWSKVGLLLQELHRSKIAVQNVTYYRQIAPRSLSTFNYCILVAIDLQTTLDQINCLNVLQMHRGSNLPGYVSLFQRMTSKHLKPDENPEDELDAILGAIEETTQKPRHKRHVQTV